MSVPKIHYFGVSGRGEFIKLILEDAGQPYEFFAHIPGKHREVLGDKLAFGQLPLYEEEDMSLVQSGAIFRYLAKKHGVYPKDLMESARAEMLVDGVFDLVAKYLQVVLYRTLQESDFVQKVLPEWLRSLEKVLRQHRDGTEWVVSQFSFADLALFQIVDAISKNISGGADVLKQYPLLLAHRDRVILRPNIKAYLNSDRRQ